MILDIMEETKDRIVYQVINHYGDSFIRVIERLSKHTKLIGRFTYKECSFKSYGYKRDDKK